MAAYATYPSLEDRRVVVTGGASGIGAALVTEFARQGSAVFFVDLNAAAAADLITEIEIMQPRHLPHFAEVDLRDIEALRASVAEADQVLGGFDVLVNNAANDDRHDWSEVTPEYWDDRIAINLGHYFFAIQAVAPSMIAAGSGSIINIGSSSWMVKLDVFPGYAIAKSAIEGITRTMARTLGRHDIRVNTVLPGWVATERQLTKWYTPESEARILESQALARRIEPTEFVQMVLFLAADDGAACTAQQFIVDAGRL